jgi:hypothetical protein
MSSVYLYIYGSNTGIKDTKVFSDVERLNVFLSENSDRNFLHDQTYKAFNENSKLENYNIVEKLYYIDIKKIMINEDKESKEEKKRVEKEEKKKVEEKEEKKIYTLTLTQLDGIYLPNSSGYVYLLSEKKDIVIEQMKELGIGQFNYICESYNIKQFKRNNKRVKRFLSNFVSNSFWDNSFTFMVNLQEEEDFEPTEEDYSDVETLVFQFIYPEQLKIYINNADNCNKYQSYEYLVQENNIHDCPLKVDYFGNEYEVKIEEKKVEEKPEKKVKPKSTKNKYNQFNIFVNEYFGDKYDPKTVKEKLLNGFYSNIESYEENENPLLSVLPNAILEVIEIPDFMCGTDSSYESLMAMIRENDEMIRELYNLIRTWPEIEELLDNKGLIAVALDQEEKYEEESKPKCNPKKVVKKTIKEEEVKTTTFSKSDFLNELKHLYTNNYCIVYNDNHYLRANDKKKKNDISLSYQYLINESKDVKNELDHINLKSLITVLSDNYSKKMLMSMPTKLRSKLKIIDNLPAEDFDVYITGDEVMLDIIEYESAGDENDSE